LDYSLQLSLGIQNFSRSRNLTARPLASPELLRVNRDDENNE
jgi:hypothetical protein